MGCIRISNYSGLPRWLSGKECTCQCRRPGLIPRLGRSPGLGNGNPLQYSCLEIPWTEEPGGLQSMELQRAGHDWACTRIQLFQDFLLRTLIFCWKNCPKLPQNLCSWSIDCIYGSISVLYSSDLYIYPYANILLATTHTHTIYVAIP